MMARNQHAFEGFVHSRNGHASSDLGIGDREHPLMNDLKNSISRSAMRYQMGSAGGMSSHPASQLSKESSNRQPGQTPTVGRIVTREVDLRHHDVEDDEYDEDERHS